MGRLIVTLVTASAVFALRAATPTPREINQAREWSKNHFPNVPAAAGLLPWSFVYGGRSLSGVPAGWNLQVSPETHQGVEIQRSFTITDPATSLKITAQLTCYDDYPALEWVLFFENTGRNATPLLQSVRALDVHIGTDARKVVLHRALGGSNKPTDFAPVEQPLDPGTEASFAPVGGLSSAETALPFFNLQAPASGSEGVQSNQGTFSADPLRGGGVMMAVGWSGQWSARFVHDPQGVLVQAGMEHTSLRLMPGERIRTPRILLLFWQGTDWLRGCNLLRSFLLAHRTPRPGGRLPDVPIAAMPWWQFNYGNSATEQNQTKFASLYHTKRIPVDAFWLDAGWFEGGWPRGVGNWTAKNAAFPRGLGALSDAVHKLGMSFIVWFEPEHVAPGTWLAQHHPEWLLGQGEQKLLNLGNPQARRWLTDHISQIITEGRIDIYRHDFGLMPLEYWRDADPPDQQGITEIRYVEGFYEYWDELLRLHPRLLIDNGAGGGRRIDLETLARSVPLWRFDYFGGEMEAFQATGVGLDLYVPLSSTGVPITDNNLHAALPDLYSSRSAMSAGLPLTWDVRRQDFDDVLARRLVREQQRLRELYRGDIYPLTPISANDQTWLAYQCDRPDLGSGMVMAFRRAKAPEDSITVNLRGLEANSTYEIEDVDSGNRQRVRSKELAAGFRLHAATRPASVLLIYNIAKSPE
jgi:alpha-galactosidase